MALFEGFEKIRIKANGVSINLVRGQGIDCGHFLPEERPEETTAAVLEFLREIQ